jgi:hypothetical protein
MPATVQWYTGIVRKKLNNKKLKKYSINAVT